jgi:hypothetical protein
LTRLAHIAIAAALVMGGCAQRSYVLGQGDANYDALAQATRECQARGGEIRLRPGYDNHELSGYLCLLGNAR